MVVTSLWYGVASLLLSVQAAAIPDVLRVGVTDFPPFTWPSKRLPDQPGTDWTGYDVELFKLVASRMNLSYVFVDLGEINYFDSLRLALDDMSDPNTIHLVFNGITLDKAAAGHGKPTRGTGAYGLSTAMSANSTEQRDLWIFAKVFSWPVWLLIFITAFIVVPGLLLLFEKEYELRGLGTPPLLAGGRLWASWLQATYITLARPLVLGSGPELLSTAARVTMFAFGTLGLVLYAAYVAGLSHWIMFWPGSTAVEKLEKLDDGSLRLATWSYYVDAVISLNGVVPLELQLDTDQGMSEAMAMLKAGELDGIIYDTLWLQGRANKDCSIKMVGREFRHADYVWLFNIHFPDDFVHEVNAVLADLWPQSWDLAQTFFYSSTCGDTTILSESYEFQGFGLSTVGGVFIVVGCIVGVALLLLIAPLISCKLETDVTQSSRRSPWASAVSELLSVIAALHATLRAAGQEVSITIEEEPAQGGAPRSLASPAPSHMEPGDHSVSHNHSPAPSHHGAGGQRQPRPGSSRQAHSPSPRPPLHRLAETSSVHSAPGAPASGGPSSSTHPSGLAAVTATSAGTPAGPRSRGSVTLSGPLLAPAPALPPSAAAPAAPQPTAGHVQMAPQRPSPSAPSHPHHHAS